MAGEKNFETRLKNWLKTEGIYDIGTARNKMTIPPCGYYEKRWGGGYSKSGLPDMHIVVNFINVDVELKAARGVASDLQKQKIVQINNSSSIGIILYPDGFEQFKAIIRGLKRCNIPTAGLNYLKSANSSSKCNILTELEQ